MSLALWVDRPKLAQLHCSRKYSSGVASQKSGGNEEGREIKVTSTSWTKVRNLQMGGAANRTNWSVQVELFASTKENQNLGQGMRL